MADTLPLASALAADHPEDAVALLIEFGAEQAAAFLALLDEAPAASLLGAMRPARGAACITAMPDAVAVRRLSILTPRAAADVLRNLSADKRTALLSQLSRIKQMQIGLALRQPPRTVGAWMDSTVLPVLPDETVAAVRLMLSHQSPIPTHVFVVDGDRRLLGSVAASAVFAASDEVHIYDIYTVGVPFLRANAALEAALTDPGWQDDDVMPVIDHTNRFLGAIRFAVLRQALTDHRPDDRAPILGSTGSVIDLANLYYIGMARIIDASFARRRSDAKVRKEGVS